MEKYLGVKLVEAEPMSAEESRKAKNFNNPATEVTDNEGYKVVYEGGYTSWSPKDVFEKAYKRIDSFEIKTIDVDPRSGDWDFVRCEFQGDC